MDSKFHNRRQAGQLLSQRLEQQSWNQTGWVLALPRGGVPIGYEIACSLNWPLDVWLVRKLGVPNQPELAMGAIAAPNTQVINQDLIKRLNVSEEQLLATTQAETKELARRDRSYRQGSPLPNIVNRPVIVVDDGLATGATLQAAILAIQNFHPDSITVAVPVAAPGSLQKIQRLVDKVVCLAMPELMGAISQWYVRFNAVSDQEVVELLKDANQSRRTLTDE
ncbi:phosphoribosyltransferase family protein [Oscillatoria sp. CS-180]|uniref:phosphoribosyltransferase n=1 Tax=Oscillatoria sp. CS-180 TaxID=3021720 RepID=UPI002330EC6E|nr:phosphoribosyltransferase family protein [Oscillatoria sp. CS-180]MDB9526614.1 phosphoribosyltransferase family protein [Oscillatoria sp. CS-180]